jgi:sugar phosphate isomerase/epimerase
MIKVGCADYTFPLLSHEAVLNHIRGMDLDSVDFGLFGNRSHLRPEVIRLDTAMWGGRVRERLERTGLDVGDVFFIPWTNLIRMCTNHPDPAERAESRALFVDVLDFAHRVGSPGVTMPCGAVFGDESVTESLRRSAEELRWRVEACDRLGLQARVEGGVGQNTDTPEKLLELLGMTPGLKSTFDYAHYVHGGFGNADVEPLLPHVGHIQIRGAAPGRMQLVFQENQVDYGWMIDRLVEIGYNGYMSVEYVWMQLWDCNKTDNTMETIQFRDFIRAHIEGREYVPFQPPI